MNVATAGTLRRLATLLTVLFFMCTLGIAAFVPTAHSKATAKPSFNAAAKGAKPGYTQPKPVMRPPAPRARSVRTTPTARKMHTQKSPVKAAPRARTSTAGSRNLRKSVATPGKSRSAKPTVALSKSRPAGSKGSLRNATGQKKAASVARPAKSSRASRPTLRTNTKKSTPQQQKKAQLGRAVGAPKASRNAGTRLTKAGKASTRARSGATRGPHASTIKVTNNNQSKRSLALAKGSKATSGLENRGVRPKPGTRVRPEGVPANWRIRNTISKGGTMYYNPKNKAENVRVMQGRADSKYPNSQKPYARQQHRGGAYFKQDGSLSTVRKGAEASAHIPLNDFIFRQ